MTHSRLFEAGRVVLVPAIVCLMLIGPVGQALAAAAPTTLFADVPSDHWAKAWIEALYVNGITAGCGDGKYCPGETVSRAQMAVFLLRGIHESAYDPPPATGTLFGDVPLGHWAAPWVEDLAEQGLTGGCGNGNFCPERAVTRAQMAIFLLRATMGPSYSPPPASGAMFGDVPRDHWAAAWIEELARQGTTGGCGAGAFCPEQMVTRDQMAVFLVRAFDLPAPGFETLVMLLINTAREDSGRPLLRAQAQLAAAAGAHSASMAANDYFSHTGLDGSTVDERVRLQGYVWRAVGENIAAGYSTPEAVVQAWMNSADHRSNILAREFEDMGVGYAHDSSSTYGAYWTAVFAAPR